MLWKRFWVVLVLSLVPFFAEAENKFSVEFFPREPLSELLLPGSPFPEVRVPGGELSELKGTEFLSFLTIGKAIPLLGVNVMGRMPKLTLRVGDLAGDERLDGENGLTMTLIGAVVARGAEEGAFTYEASGKIFLDAPIPIDFGIREKGRGSLISYERVPTSQTLFGAIYLVGRSFWSEQCLVLKIGIDDLPIDLSRGPEPNFALAVELPSLLPEEWFKMSPAFSIYGEMSEGPVVNVSAQLGIIVESRATGRGAFIYGMVECAAGEQWKFASGIKLNI